MSEKFQYTAEVEGAPEIPGEGKPRRNVWTKDRLIDHPEGVVTMWDNFLNGHNESAHRHALGVRSVVDGEAGEYVWQTYDEVFQRVTNLGAGLEHLGLERQQPLGFYSVNRPEWTLAEQTSYKHAFINVALYDTLGKEAVVFIINQTEMEFILASADKIAQLLSYKPELPTLKHIVSMDEDVDQALITQAEQLGIKIITFKAVEKLGTENRKDTYEPPKPDDIGTICYTSGTTGMPKGAVLTQAQMLAPLSGTIVLMGLGKFPTVSKDDVHMSYLPLAHVLERAVQATIINRGAAIGYYQGDTLKLLDDVAVLKPTVFVSVPRLFNRIYDRVLSGVKAKGGIAAALFNQAFAAKKENLKRSHNKHWIWDRLVFAQIKARLGGRVRLILSGSAPISADVMDFLRICFSAQVIEGYGQTENFVGGCITLSGDLEAGHVGPPFPCSEVKLVDVPDMEYTSKDLPSPRGEICIRGNSVLKEYYKNPEKTAETVDKDGWLHTGDIGKWDDQGRLCIIDRLKNIFKLAQGEYIAPEKIEGVYQKHELVGQAYVHGDSLQSTIIAVIVPTESTLKAYAAEQEELASLSFEDLCKNPTVKKYLLKEITTFGKKNDLKGFENIKAIHLESSEFTVENDLLTPTFKLKREVAKKRYQKEIDEMYAEINKTSK